MVFKKQVYKLLAYIQDKPYFKNPILMGGPKKRNQRQKFAYHDERGHMTKNYRALKSFLDKLV